MRRVLFFAVILCLFSVPAFCAPYLGKELEFHQPDGSPIAVRLWGDEFYIRVETLDGYSLVRDPVSGFICYAELNSDGSDFISTGIPYTGQTVEKQKHSGLWPSAKGDGIKKGLRLKRQTVIEKADRNRQLLRRDKHGRILPAPDSGAYSAVHAQADSPAPLIGSIVGLTLLIQFPDVPATIPQAAIDNYCNQVGYTGYGNNGSVRDYFYDVSNSNLTYTNYVTVYYTALHNRSYYTDPSISYGTRARELIQEALLWLDNTSGQNFNFRTVSTDSSNYMLAINAFYVGPTVNNWAEGLWPHMSSMYGMFTSNEGVKSGVYQISNIGSSLALGTFCHENGHMICDYPDLYDYGYESYGAGNYCLMAYGGSDYNPIPPNPYLRDIKGWENVTVFPHLPGVQYFLQSNSNTSYKYLNPNNSTEFFYIDSRTKTGRNSSLPDDGLVIWHIDENGSNDNEQMTTSQHYLVSVEQADGLFHLEHNNNAGGSDDLFHAGYKDIFDNTTNPNAKWWNSDNSNLVIREISAVSSTMSFVYDDGTVPQPPVAQNSSASTQINTSVPIMLVAIDEGLPNPPGTLAYIITSLPSNGELSNPGAGSIATVPYTLAGNGNQVIYTPTTGYSGTDNFTFKANDGGTAPQGGDSNQANVSISIVTVFLEEDFESSFIDGAPAGWSKLFLKDTVDWVRNSGDYRNNGSHGGSYNALLYYANNKRDHKTYLITPAINFVSGTQNSTLEFWHKQAFWYPDQDTLTIYYKTSAGGSWVELANYTTDVPNWTKRTISLPNTSSEYYIGFLGNAKYGYGVCIDDVKVMGIVPVVQYAISGYCLEPDGNTPVEGVLISTDTNDVNSITDSNGYYEIVVPYNWSGTATPIKESYTFEPNGILYNNVVTNEVNDYTATLMTFKISGHVLEQDLITPISDVNVCAANGGGQWTSRNGGGSAKTDVNGCYEVVVDYNWSGAVTPTKYAYAFVEPNIVYTNVLADHNNQDYTGRLLTFAISGYVRNDCNIPIKDVEVTANNGGNSVITDANGFYEVWVDYNWAGMVTPAKSNYTFEPNSISYTDVLGNITYQDYVANNIYDLDCDGSIGFGDIVVMSENWLKTGEDIPGDFYKDDDDIVNFLDFADFALIWQNQ
jgi:M6 family metalloprotease-like protein